MCRKLNFLVSFVLVLSIAGNIANADISDGLLVWHDFQDLLDDSGNGHDAVLSGDAYISDGLLHLDGTEDYADIGTPAGFGPVNPLVDAESDFTVAVAYACTSTAEDDQGSILVSVGPAAADGSGDFSLGTSNDAQYIDHWWTAAVGSDQSGVGYADGTVHLVVVTYEQATDTYTFYHIDAGVAVDHGSEVMDDWSGEWDESLDYGIRLGSHRNATLRADEGPGFFPDLEGQIDMFAIWDRALETSEMPEIAEHMPGTPEKAANPSPKDGATDVLRKVVLSWTPGVFADKHDVYFGTSLADVNDAKTTVDPNGVYKGRQDPDSYAVPETLAFSQTYYWRIDEVNAPPDPTMYKGDVWSFTAEPFAYAIDGNNITVTASSYQEGRDPENTINGSGLDDDLHSAIEADMWLSSDTGPEPAWIQYEFDKVYKLYQMWVWNFNGPWEFLLGFGFRDVTIEYSTNGADWMELVGVSEFDQAPGKKNYAHNTPVEFNGLAAKYIKITANSNWSIYPQYGLSEVRFLYIPVRAREPNPADGDEGVALDVVLGFRAGREATKHDVYFSSKRKAVVDGAAYVGTVLDTSYDAGSLHSLELGKTYYWKINEVNDAESPTTWQGDLWSFDTLPYLVVDDMEDYNDYCNRIFYTWADGWGHSGDATCGVAPYAGNGSGSTVGNLTEPYAERTIVHEGSQSMPMDYDNAAAPYYSQTLREWTVPQDWTIKGVKALTLSFRGHPAVVGSFSYDPAEDIYTMDARGEDIWDVPDYPGADVGHYHDEFYYAYKRLSGNGSIEAQVLSIENTDGWTKAGVMIRETRDPNSAHAMVVVTPDSGVAFQGRPNTGGESFTMEEDGEAPYWVRLSRSANLFTAEYSDDGSTWEVLGSVRSIPMAGDVYIGLALTSHNADETCTATFSDVTTGGGVTGQWQSQDIGITKNVADQLYVAVEDSTGKSKVVDHPDPDAVLSDTWQEWNIPLKDFSDAGLNIQSIAKMYIGVGDRDHPQPDGAGSLYIDDIRLYPSRCIPEYGPAGDLTNDCIVSFEDIEAIANNWLNAGSAGDTDPLVEYTFSSNDLTDTSGNNYHGIGQNSPNVHAGILTLDGTNFVDIPLSRNNPFDGSRDFTIEMDFRTTGGGVLISSARDDEPDNHAMAVYILTEEWQEPGEGEGELFYDNFYVAAASTFREGAVWPGDGQWHTLRITYDASEEAAEIHLLDGEDSYEIGEFNPAIPNIQDDTVRIGSTLCIQQGIDLDFGNFVGDIDNVRIYAGPPASDLNDDNIVNFKDFSILANEWLEEKLWP